MVTGDTSLDSVYGSPGEECCACTGDPCHDPRQVRGRGDRERETETDRQTDRQTGQRETERERETKRGGREKVREGRGD